MAIKKNSPGTKKAPAPRRASPSAAVAATVNVPHLKEERLPKPEDDAQWPVQEWITGAERCVREQPLKCAGAVLAFGVLTSIVPLSRIFSFFIGGAFAALRPLLMVAGVMKVIEEVERRSES